MSTSITKRFVKWWKRHEPCEHQIDTRLNLIEQDPSLFHHSMIYYEYDTAGGKLPRNDHYHVCNICGKKCKEFVLRLEIMRNYRINK